MCGVNKINTRCWQMHIVIFLSYCHVNYLPSGRTAAVGSFAEVLHVCHHPIIDLRQRQPLLRRALNGGGDQVGVRGRAPGVTSRWPLHPSSGRRERVIGHGRSDVIIIQASVPCVTAGPRHRRCRPLHWLVADFHCQTTTCMARDDSRRPTGAWSYHPVDRKLTR